MAVEALPEVDLLPPLKLRLLAKPDGTLASMKLNDKVLASTQQLEQELIKILGDDRGPDSLFQKLELVLEADDDLQMRHVSQVYSAVSGYRNSSGKFIPLVQNVFIFRPGTIEELEIEGSGRSVDRGD